MMAQPQPVVYSAAPAAGGSPVALSASRSFRKQRTIKSRKVTSTLGDPKGRLANRGVVTYGAPPAAGGTIHALVCALDYKATPNALTCSVDGNNFQALLKACGVQHVDVLYDNQCTKQGMIQAIQKVARETGPQDTFLFFYAGHGTSVTDTDGDEEDHKDEAFVCVTPTGQLDLTNQLLTDDEFAATVTGSLPFSSTFVSVTDCCHSGSICDFKRSCWEGRKGVSISGCRDTQTSGDTGNGGICTHAMLLAIEALQKKGQQNYKVQTYFAEVLSQDDTTFASPQDITIDSTTAFVTAQTEWPLIPKSTYTAPYHGGAAAAPAFAPAAQPASVSAPVAQPAYTVAPASVSAPVAQPGYTVAPAQYITAPAAQVSHQPSYITAPAAQVSHQPSYTVAPAQYITSPAPASPKFTVTGGSAEMPAYTFAPAQYVSAAPAQQPAKYVTTTAGGAAQYTTAPAQYVTAPPQYVTQGAAQIATSQPQYTTAPAVQYTTAQPQFISGGYAQIQQAPTVPSMQYTPAEPVGGYPPMQTQANALFDIIDRNHDGQITRSEFNAVVHN